MIDTPQRPARKLPVETVLKRAFLYAWESRNLLLRPYLIFAALLIATDLIAEVFAGPKNLIAAEILLVAQGLITTAFAVGIHRFVLLNETPKGVGFFHLDRYFVRYILISIILGLLLLVAAAPSVALQQTVGGGAPGGTAGIAALFALVFFVTSVLAVVRLSLLLPSAAVGDETPAKTIWQTTYGNGFRLMATGLLTAFPFFVAAVILSSAPDGELLRIAAIVVSGLIAPAEVIVLNTAQALCYDLLVRGNGPAVAEPPRR